ncbi:MULTISPECIES: type I glutamate--ammonia ligase [Bacillaceae]|uniref:Glutamine synthetase n=1 Tax=Bacillus infantis TaxID=324767 RepID=A0A5D4SM08_9BACI|nr:type I glutamate--ammonia ligase [Bacillus infantis]MDW2876052.1 type I glutamate--ammonia ligase [Bacillus infantis]TYS64290.1 type I glutamate--ammonia ligase [Bacillus infantis]
MTQVSEQNKNYIKIKEAQKKYHIELLHLQFVDLEGVLKHVTITFDQLDDALEGKIMFDGSSIQGFSPINQSDLYLKPDINTFSVIPWSIEEGYSEARLLCSVANPDGTPFEGDPRNVLKRTVEKAASYDYSISIGPELEFFLFGMDESGNPTTVPQDSGGYFEPAHDLGEKVRLEIYRTLKAMGFKIEASHHEVAMGQHEINFKFMDALASADNATTYKWIVKNIAKNFNLHASFMPKPVQGLNGSGMHVNISLFKDGQNVFFNENDPNGLSEDTYYFINGLMKNIATLTAITNPTVNSYKRLVPGFEAPCYMAWSTCNRSTLIRIPSSRGAATRVEARHPDPCANPYLAFSVIAEAGLEGIRLKQRPADPINEDIYSMPESKRELLRISHLPDNLETALDLLADSPLARKILGDHIFRKFISLKRAEWKEYRNTVHDWELKRYQMKF